MVPPPSHESSHWDSAPLAFALLPALGGLFFTNGSSVITDVMLLGFAAILLNWSVRIPWEWYHSAQSIRKSEEYNEDLTGEVESEDDAALESSRSSLDEKNEDKQAPKSQRKSSASSFSRRPAHETATKELYAHEMLALLSCFVFPLAGAYILHSIRSQLSRPSEGLVSNYNLTIFLLASELRPMAHLVRLVMARTLHLQRVVNSNPYDNSNTKIAEETQDLVRRLEDLESLALKVESAKGSASESVLTGKQSAILTLDIRRTLQPDLDALNRAVRRYEKRATLQSFQTESRLLDLEARLNDAISLAAAAANNSQKRSVPGIAFEWLSSAVVLPFHAAGAVMSLPFKTILGVVKYSQIITGAQEPIDKPKKISNGRYVPHTRLGDRVQGRVKK